ncbi:hypothetical protein [Bartonella sp. HY761]|uniref:hypothetical protein n=1 Tax=Bartonella sp. HY761 TaxID=2979330 RepID=UPI00220B6802|nr:hypothetical protein [Bartonella sp. HY761]UXN05154.1 hypothetical protein N6A79_07400 [Bartonella sp. HY761]
MALHLVDKIAEFLTNNPNQKFTAPDIANWIYQTYPDECKVKQKNSKAIKMPLDSPEALIQQLIREINASRTRIEKKNIKLTEGRPRKFYFTNESDHTEVIKAETIKAPNLENELATILSEHALYPLLADYLTQEFGIYSKRINEKRSSNKRSPNGNKWLYPDLVAMENLSKDWNQEIKNCVKEYFDKKTRLWSFEVKILINSSNVREVFFQTVSNSS